MPQCLHHDCARNEVLDVESLGSFQPFPNIRRPQAHGHHRPDENVPTRPWSTRLSAPLQPSHQLVGDKRAGADRVGGDVPRDGDALALESANQWLVLARLLDRPRVAERDCGHRHGAVLGRDDGRLPPRSGDGVVSSTQSEAKQSHHGCGSTQRVVMGRYHPQIHRVPRVARLVALSLPWRRQPPTTKQQKVQRRVIELAGYHPSPSLTSSLDPRSRMTGWPERTCITQHAEQASTVPIGGGAIVAAVCWPIECRQLREAATSSRPLPSLADPLECARRRGAGLVRWRRVPRWRRQRLGEWAFLAQRA